MSKAQKPPPRLFVIFAKEAHEAVIFRRGPSEWFHVIRWDTQHDKFYPGAWIRGRIYPEKCDLSPNGELLLCFIHQIRKIGTSYSDAWSAVSRSPWLEAIGLWPQGTTYGGGGRFIDNRTLMLRHYPIEAHPKHPGKGLKVDFPEQHIPIPLHSSTEEVEDAEWSGRDQNGRLVYTLDGKLMAAEKKSSKFMCLMDFNNMQPDPQPAPEWATRRLALEKRKPKVSKTRRTNRSKR